MTTDTDLPVIHVVDDDQEFRDGLSRLLRAAGYVARTYATAGDFLLSPQDDSMGCIVLDVRMPGPSGLELQAALAARPNPLPVIFLTGHGAVPDSVRAMKAGAVDFLTKPVESETLLAAIKTALAGEVKRRATSQKTKALRDRYAGLTPREVQVLNGVIAGKLNKQIAHDLGTTERTIKWHRAQVMEKMGASSLAELVHIAEQLIAAGTTLRSPPGEV